MNAPPLSETSRPETSRPETSRPESSRPETSRAESSRPESTRQTYYNIQALRGVAAFIVFATHVLASFGDRVPFLTRLRAFQVGPAGVDIFFVISGFIVSLTAQKAIEQGSARQFALRRLFRIYPVYWLVLAFSYWASSKFTVGAGMSTDAPWRFLFALSTSNPYVMLAWTLFYELYFYLMLTVLIAFRPKNIFVPLLGWVMLELGLIAHGVLFPQQALELVSSPLLLEFAAGCFVGWLMLQPPTGAGLRILSLGLVSFVVGAIVHAYSDPMWSAWPRVACFGAPSVLVVYGLVAIERERNWVLPRWMQRIGDASYSLYIWHQLVVGAGGRWRWLAACC